MRIIPLERGGRSRSGSSKTGIEWAFKLRMARIRPARRCRTKELESTLALVSYVAECPVYRRGMGEATISSREPIDDYGYGGGELAGRTFGGRSGRWSRQGPRSSRPTVSLGPSRP